MKQTLVATSVVAADASLDGTWAPELREAGDRVGGMKPPTGAKVEVKQRN